MNNDQDSGKFEYSGLERILHEKARLGIMTSLFTKKDGHTFNGLKKLCNLTDGNLSRHLHILEEAGLVKILKKFEGNKPLTLCIITNFGREKFIGYIGELEKVIKDAMKDINEEDKKNFFSPDLSHG